jgi:hypothetical protein
MGMEVLGCDGLGSMPSLNNPWERGGVTFHSEKKSASHWGKNLFVLGKIKFWTHRDCFRYTKTPFHKKKIGHSPPPPAGKKSARG